MSETNLEDFRKEQLKGWDTRWNEGKTAWDRQGTHKAFKNFLLEESGKNGVPAVPREGKAVVGGCGTGYDVAVLASWGLDVTGVDSSALAIPAATKHLDKALAEDKEARARAKVIQADFFKLERPEGGFDVMYDYTFLCALPPILRPTWSETYSRLSHPGTILIMLQFPLVESLTPNRNPPGPPFELMEEDFEKVLPEDKWEKVWERWVEREESPFGGDEGYEAGRERLAVYVRK